MIIISEFLPNPAGKDTDGEWIELFNNTSGLVDISGWKLKDSSNKTFVFVNQKIGAEEYLVLDYKTSKISLNNNGEALFLYDKQGNLVDRAEYSGTAESGKSLIRKDNRFIFTDKPTPGQANLFKVTEAGNLPSTLSSLSKNYESQSSGGNTTNQSSLINSNGFGIGNLAIGLVLALILSIVFIMIYKKLNLD